MWSFGLMILVKIQLVSKTKTVFQSSTHFLPCVCMLCGVSLQRSPTHTWVWRLGILIWSMRRKGASRPSSWFCMPSIPIRCTPGELIHSKKRQHQPLFKFQDEDADRYCISWQWSCRFEVSAYEWAALRAKLLLAGWALTCSRLDQFHRTCGKVRRRNKRGVNLRQLYWKLVDASRIIESLAITQESPCCTFFSQQKAEQIMIHNMISCAII